MRWLSLFVTPMCALMVGTARADPTPKQAAYCVAALKSRAEPLAERVRRGDNAAETQLFPIVTASFAFVGSAYKQGVRKPEADTLVEQAQAAQAKLPRSELGKVQDGCQAQGTQIYANANFFEQQFVGHAARNRIAKLRKTS